MPLFSSKPLVQDFHSLQHGQYRVWDRFVRLFHWLLVLSIGVAGLSGFVLGAGWIRLHIIAATIAMALVAMRLIWGFLGTTFARFSGFLVLQPKILGQYVQALRAGMAPRHIGHNPLGGAMVLALIITIAALGLSGAMVLGGLLRVGPLAADLGYGVGRVVAELHELLAFGLLGLVVLHLGGVIYESRRERENLTRAMVTGRKETRPGDVLAPVHRPNVVISVLIMVLLLVGAGGLGLFLMQRPNPNMPVAVAQFDPLFKQECSACHMLYHPSLLPRQDWETLMGGLDDHFGEDASLGAAATAQILDWLRANGAETADTRPAHLFRIAADGGGLGSITKTKTWLHLHEEVLESGAFDLKSVRNRSNCQACHRDAETGMFSPFNIIVPKE